MPRPRRQWFPGAIYHVISRGVNRSPIFLHEKDYEKFLSILDNTLHYSPFNLHAYCLMSNHYHLLLGTKKDPLMKIMHAVNGAYASWFNKKYDHSGHVFQSRYTASPVPSDYAMMTVSAYIHNNPRTANITSNPEDYPWSSYQYYCIPDIIAERNPKPFDTASTTTPGEETAYAMEALSRLHSPPILPGCAPRSPPHAFTTDRLRQLFPTPLHHYYPRFTEREWKLRVLQKSALLTKKQEE